MGNTLTARFWEKVERGGPDDCWLWTAAVTTSGYGVLQRGSRGQGLIRAHRLAYQLRHGDIPGGALVLHSCNNKLCVNPAHLSTGTHSDNLKQAWDDGLRPEAHLDSLAAGLVNSPLTADDVRSMRNRWSAGEKGRALSERFGVSASTVSEIVNRKRWTWVD